ncbi:putative noranthrone synthase [Lupinus albus]|uniref:Trimethylguanosine synthase n=1 Tax=Lupinus albus TaxID=3870 RepID=A0A6A4NCB5_LUPAL|nr:putative noranthrone synthase [Lupinus albus]
MYLPIQTIEFSKIGRLRREKSGPAKGKWKDTHSKIPRTCHNLVDESIYKVNAEEISSTADSHDKRNSSYPPYNSACFTMAGNGVSKEKNKDSDCESICDNYCADYTILPAQTLIDEKFEGKQCDEHSAGIDITKHSKEQSLHHSDEYLDRSSCNSEVSCCSTSITAEHNISNNGRCIPATSEANSRHSENIVVDVSGVDTKSEPVISKEKYKVKRRRHEKFNAETRDMPEEYPAAIEKYWQQRYILFSKFDVGVKMDEEGWFSVTPEVIAQYQAERCACGTIIDCFTGVGGNSIQFAQWCTNVIAIDIDPLKIDYAKHNAAIYRMENRIEFIVGDSFLLAPTLKADTVFLSPPWGGPDYNKVKTFDMKTMLRPHDGLTLFNAAKKIAHRVVMFLPKNVNFNQLAELALSARPPWSLEVEKIYLNGRLKAITAYFSDPLPLQRRCRK